MRGRTYASITVVDVRSYSRYSPETRCERETSPSKPAERSTRAASLEDRVEADGRPVQEVLGAPNLLGCHGRGHRCGDSLLGCGRSGRLLGDDDLARGVVVEDEIGEGAADVDADPRRHYEVPR